jgi:hypothetical protein
VAERFDRRARVRRRLRACDLGNCHVSQSGHTTTGQLRPDDRDALGKRNSRRKAGLEIEGADKVM